MRTKGAKGKKIVEKVVDNVVETAEVVKQTITETGEFGNQETINLVKKVNEIIKFINK